MHGAQSYITALNPARIARMRELLEAAFKPTLLEITDDSHKHAGHAGAATGMGHFTVRIQSSAFEGMNPIARHRAVYAALGTMLQTDIHALVIEATVPAQSL